MAIVAVYLVSQPSAEGLCRLWAPLTGRSDPISCGNVTGLKFHQNTDHLNVKPSLERVQKHADAQDLDLPTTETMHPRQGK